MFKPKEPESVDYKKNREEMMERTSRMTYDELTVRAKKLDPCIGDPSISIHFLTPTKQHLEDLTKNELIQFVQEKEIEVHPELYGVKAETTRVNIDIDETILSTDHLEPSTTLQEALRAQYGDKIRELIEVAEHLSELGYSVECELPDLDSDLTCLDFQQKSDGSIHLYQYAKGSSGPWDFYYIEVDKSLNIAGNGDFKCLCLCLDSFEENLIKFIDMEAEKTIEEIHENTQFGKLVDVMKFGLSEDQQKSALATHMQVLIDSVNIEKVLKKVDHDTPEHTQESFDKLKGSSQPWRDIYTEAWDATEQTSTKVEPEIDEFTRRYNDYNSGELIRQEWMVKRDELSESFEDNAKEIENLDQRIKETENASPEEIWIKFYQTEYSLDKEKAEMLYFATEGLDFNNSKTEHWEYWCGPNVAANAISQTCKTSGWFSRTDTEKGTRPDGAYAYDNEYKKAQIDMLAEGLNSGRIGSHNIKDLVKDLVDNPYSISRFMGKDVRLEQPEQNTEDIGSTDEIEEIE
jgi:hypothetical protein